MAAEPMTNRYLDEEVREFYGRLSDWIMEGAQAFGGDTALNVYSQCGDKPSPETLGEVRVMMLAAFAAKLRYRGAPDGVVEPACREVDRAFDELSSTLFADATPGVAH